MYIGYNGYWLVAGNKRDSDCTQNNQAIQFWPQNKDSVSKKVNDDIENPWRETERYHDFLRNWKKILIINEMEREREGEWWQIVGEW